MAIYWEDAPFHAGDDVRFAIAGEVADPGMRAVIGDADRLAETAKRDGVLERRFFLGSTVAKQVDAAAILATAVALVSAALAREAALGAVERLHAMPEARSSGI